MNMYVALVTIASLVLVTACGPNYVPSPNFRGGAINPICIFLCDAKFSNADAKEGAALTSSNTQSGTTATGGDKSAYPQP